MTSIAASSVILMVSLLELWFKSSYSGGSGTECVECALVAGDTLVRDSKCETVPAITVGRGAWQAFLGAVLEHGRSAR